MNENTMQLIEKLAQKLGTTSQYLWGVLIKQAPIAATTTLIQTAFVFVFGYILFKTHKNLSKVKDYNGYKETGYAYYEEAAVLPMVAGFIIFAVLLFACFICSSDVINGYFNPEYWALKEVMDSLKR